MQRREFLKKSAATVALSGSVGPLFLNAEDKAGSKRPVIGTGEHKYECYHDWGQLPSSLTWQTTHGVTIDSQGLIHIKQQGHDKKPKQDCVVVFDPTGKFVRSWGKDFHPGGHGIDLRKEGSEEFLYLCDTAHGQVVKANLKGDIVWKLNYPQEPEIYQKKARYSPTNLAFAPDGGFYVGDGYGSNYIHQYDKDAKWVRTWGGTGTEPGKMKTPHGIWLDNRPGRDVSIVVADRANARLQYFSLEGKHLGFVQDLLFPAHFDIRGEVLMIPDLHARITLLDKDNKVITHLGDDEEWRKEVLKGFAVRREPKRWKPGKFVHPHDACFDKDGNIYVVEWVDTGRVSFLKKVS